MQIYEKNNDFKSKSKRLKMRAQPVFKTKFTIFICKFVNIC